MTFCLRCNEDLFWCKCGDKCKPYPHQCGSPVPIDHNAPAQSVFPADAEEDYCEWLNTRDRIQNERDSEDAEYFRRETLTAQSE